MHVIAYKLLVLLNFTGTSNMLPNSCGPDVTRRRTWQNPAWWDKASFRMICWHKIPVPFMPLTEMQVSPRNEHHVQTLTEAVLSTACVKRQLKCKFRSKMEIHRLQKQGLGCWGRDGGMQCIAITKRDLRPTLATGFACEDAVVACNQQNLSWQPWCQEKVLMSHNNVANSSLFTRALAAQL